MKQDKKKNKITVSMAISDMPLSLHKQFVGDVGRKYNDIYWVKLMDLMHKAEAYDLLIKSGGIDYSMNEEDVEEEKEEEKPNVVQTLGGDIEIGGKRK